MNPEQADSIDLSLRHNSERVRLDFVFPALTGETDEESNLPIANYTQGNSQFVGTEASLEARVLGTLWFNGKIDYTRAELTELNKPLPRIPPLRGSLGLDWSYNALRIQPELVFVNRQIRLFDNETPTAGYAVLNVNASYTIVTERLAHIFSIAGHNLGDALYRNHLSFVKDIAPEMGHSVRLNYSLRF